MSRKKNKSTRKRIAFKWWQKMLLIVGCTGLCVLLTWLLCEKWLAPTYVDTMRATLTIDKSSMDEMKSQRSEYVEDILDIQGSRGSLLAKPGEKEGVGDYYKDISLAMGGEEGESTFSEDRLYDLFQSGINSVDPDDAHQTVQICIENPDSGTVRIEDNSDLRRLVRLAGEKFVALVFDGDVTEEQAKITYAVASAKKANAQANQPEYDQYEWIEVNPDEVTDPYDVWAITITFSKEAIDALPNRGSFYKKQVDLPELLENSMTDSDYQRIVEEAGVDIKPADLRDKLKYSTTIDELVLNVDATTDLGQEETGKLAAAAANQAGRVIFRTMLGITDEEELRFRYNMDELAGTFEPYQSQAVSIAGAYVQSFYSDRPQFRTDIAMTARAMELDLAEFFAEDVKKGGQSSTFYSNLAQEWSSKDTLSEKGRNAYNGIAETGSIYSLIEDDIKKVVILEDSGDSAGRSVLIHVDTEQAVGLMKKGIEDYCAELEKSLDKEITDEELHREAVEELRANKAVLLEEVEQLAGSMEDTVVTRVDYVFFGYGKDPETYRDITSEGGTVTYTVTGDGLEALKDGCYLKKASVPVDEAVRNMNTDDCCERILEKADTAGSVERLKDSISWTTEGRLTVNVSWSDKTTTTAIARAGLTVLSRYLTEHTDGHPVRMLEDTTVILREQVRTRPPATLPAMVIVGLIALVVSYAVFSQQPLFDTLVIIFFVIFTFICVFPFYYLLINTISDNTKVAGGRINFLPEGIHFKNYERVFSQPELGDALVVTVGRTILGTALMVLTSAWAGYLVTKQKMWRRSFWYRALVITMYFNAGLIPWYTNMLMLGLTGNFLAYIIPGMVAPYNIILVKTYIESIPGSLEESAIIDGASTSKVFLRIILPLSIPILATIAIFGAVGNWNSFQDSLLLMSSKPNLYTLQHRLYVYLTSTTSIDTEQISDQTAKNLQSLMNNGVTTKYTIAMVTIIPILLVYPVMQRYFVKGIMLGAVKG